MKGLIALLTVISFSAVAGDGESCRLGIHDMDKLMGQNTVLVDQVIRKLEKKNIILTDKAELSKDDFFIPNLVAVYNGKPNIPKHGFKFKTQSKLVLVPCFALPLCSPIMTEKKVTDIVGIKYKHPFTINVIQESGSKVMVYKEFKHAFNEKPTSWSENIPYDGSADQEDLALAIADAIPGCSKLRKMKQKI
jgi:hypothetical protein